MAEAADSRTPAALQRAYGEALAALRAGRAASAERSVRAILVAAPAEPASLRLLGAALLYQEKVDPAIETLERAVAAAPASHAARTDLARAYRAADRFEAARALTRAVVSAEPGFGAAWLAYGDVLIDLEKFADARFAYERARLCDPQHACIEAASAALANRERKRAEEMFREILKSDPSHIGALAGLAAISLTVSRGADALRLLRHALKQSAHLPLIWRGLCQAYSDLGRLREAEAAASKLVRIESENPKNWVALGTVYTRLMRQADALPAYQQAARLNPGEMRLHLSIGHLHKTLGNRRECESAYRHCIALDARCAEAFWCLADLKDYAFDDAEIAAMRNLLEEEGGDDEQQAYLHFALGRALENRREFQAAFAHYLVANRRRRRTVPFDIGKFEGKSERVREFFDADFFARCARDGCPDPAPIFIVGLPRSGSTLIEQILASHSQVEGTFELPNLLSYVREFDHAHAAHDGYPEALQQAPAALFGELGRRYLEETAPIRSGAARFIDKMPNNFSHVGLIHAMLPNATIIDARRHPMDSCFSTFKQHFAEGQSFSYDLEDLGRYYRCYLSLMDHWNHVLPGKVLLLQYEALVREPEATIRALLAHCGLQFESACLAFHENRRAVRTASAEQVRRPLYASAVGYWRNFAAGLDPLRRALGDGLERFEGA